jgi:PAS domain S-box-containing protein
LVALLLGWALVGASRHRADSQELVRDTELALRRIVRMQAYLAAAEASHRGFLLTGNPAHRKAREDAVRQLQRDNLALDASLDDPTQRERSRRLATLVDARIVAMLEAERIRATKGSAAASRSLAAGLADGTNARIHELVEAMSTAEARRLTERYQDDMQDESWMRRLLVLAALATVTFMVKVLWRLVRQSRGRHRAEHRLRAIANSLPGTVYVLRRTPAGVVTFDFLSVNAVQILGIDRDTVLRDATTTRQVVLHEDRDRLQAAVARSADDMSVLEVDFRVRKPDGNLRWVRSSGIPVRHANGDVVWNGYWSDITPIKQTEQALRDALQRLDDAHTVASLGDWTCDLATGAVTWSPQIYQMLGRDPALGPPDLAESVTLFENGAETIAEAFFRAQETGERQSYDLTARLANGESLTLQVFLLPQLDSTGIVTGMRGTIQDISCRKALEERLYQAKEAADSANLAKSDFLATMSHEIRTPLNGMLGILELVEQTPINPELRSALDTIRESGHSLQRIIDDILDFSKVEAGKLEIRPEPTSLVDLAAAIQRAYAGSASSHGLELRHHVDPRISAVVMVDSLRLRQILGNFVSNAIKFTPQGHVELRIRLEQREGAREALCFEVSDTGIGISAERQERLFQPFEQADIDLASRVSGTGLGLAISRRLARLMGGEVSMSSEPGRGTTLYLSLSVVPAEPGHAARPPASAPIPGPPAMIANAAPPTMPGHAAGAAPLVLVVDDHAINRMVMSKQLHTLGYAPEEAESGAEALALWASGRFALVLTDCNMPRMSGYELTRLIRERESAAGLPPMPIIACSANVIRGAREACLESGMDDYIPKPTKLLALADIMHRWLPLPAKPADEPGLAGDLEAGTAAGADAPLDIRALHGLSNGDPAVEERALAHFRRINDTDATLLLQAAERMHMASIIHLAHRIKGACKFVGAAALAAASDRLEQAAKSGAAGDIEELVKAFRTELERLNATLDAR